MKARKSRRRAVSVFLAAVILRAAVPLFADSMDFSADSVKSSNARGRERTELTGNARVVSGTTVITADRIELFGPDFQFADCSGNVAVRDEKRGIFLQTPVLSYDRVKKTSSTRGPTTLEDKKNKVVIKANILENDDTTEIVTVQVGVRILKESMVARSEYAIYHRKDSLLELTGMPVVYRDGDEYHARRIVVNTDTNAISLEGEVSGSVLQKGDDKQQDAAGGAEKK